MTNMFTNYKLTPENYIPNNMHFTNKQPPKPKYPLVAYNALNEPIGFTWSYGDTVYLEFNTTGNVVYDEGFTEDANTYLSTPVLNREEGAEEYFKKGNKVFQVLLLNSRYEVVAHCETEAATTVRVLSDSFYPAALVKGVYKLQLNLLDKNAGTRYTLIKGEDCTIFIN